MRGSHERAMACGFAYFYQFQALYYSEIMMAIFRFFFRRGKLKYYAFILLLRIR